MIDRACISLTDACNLRCRYCHFRDKQEAGTVMARDDAIGVVERINAYCRDRGIGTFKLGVVGAGEPLLEEETLVAMLDCASGDPSNAITFYTITNGTLATKDLLARLLPYRGMLKVCFSLDGPEAVHEAGRASFTRAMEGIASYRRVYGEGPSVNATVNLQTVLHAEEVLSFFEDEGLREVTFSRLVDCDDTDLAITDEQFAGFMSLARDWGIASRQFRGKMSYDCTMYGRLCGVGRTNVFLTPAGVYPCGRFYRNERYRLGDIDSPIEEIEARCSLIEPVEDGKCFFDERVKR
jgi:uncharacterized protein